MNDFLQWLTIFILFANYYATRKQVDKVIVSSNSVQNTIKGEHIVQVTGGKDITINGQDITKKQGGNERG